jgi:predicted DNA-binding protein (MmcQ/YjbR family)
MTSNDVTKLALSLPEVIEDHPFGATPDVYKVANRIFVILTPNKKQPSLSLKCEPGLALILRARYEKVTPGYHLNKRHWNSVALDGSIPDDAVEEMINHSYDMVITGLPVASRRRLLGQLQKL